MKLVRVSTTLLTFLTVFSACGKSDSDKRNEIVSGSVTNTSVGTLALVPSIVLASPTGSTSTALALNVTEGAELDSANPKDASEALDKIFANAEDIKGCLVGLGRPEPRPGNVECYGPAVQYQNHPDGVNPQGNFLPSGDLGPALILPIFPRAPIRPIFSL